MYAFVAELMPTRDEMTPAVSEVAIRAGHYLVERSYFSIEDISEVTRACQEYQATEHSQRLLRLFQRLVADRMGAKDQIPKCLNFLGHELAVKQSFDRYMKSTDEYAKLLAEWEKEKEENADAEKPIASAVLNSYIALAFLPGLFSGTDSLDVKLACKVEPIVTNGTWDQEQQEVSWGRLMAGRDAQSFDSPSFLFAIWSEPNKQAQKDLFGRTILDGKELAQYCVWYRSLNQAEADEWEKLLGRVSTDTPVLNQLNEFRFSHEPPAKPDDSGNEDLAATARELIKEGFENR